MAINSRLRFGFFRLGLVFLLVIGFRAGFASFADTNAAADASVKTDEAAGVNGQDSFRAYLQIQEQLHNTQMAIEKNRQEAEAAAAGSAEVMDGRLRKMENALAAQRLEELKDMERSGRTILYAAGAFAAMGFLVLFVAAFLQWSAVSRLAAATAHLSSVASASAPAMGLADGQMLPARALEQSTARFLSVIERLELRIHDMEAGTNSHKQLSESGTVNGEAKSLIAGTNGEHTPAEAPTESGDAITTLIGKSQTLVKLDKSEEALACLEEALAIDPNNTEILIKKGAVLERLLRFAEAVECYDRVIAQDNSLTMAYLYKGAVFNRMERYNEALECYEQALKTRQKGEAANVIFE